MIAEEMIAEEMIAEGIGKYRVNWNDIESL